MNVVAAIGFWRKHVEQTSIELGITEILILALVVFAAVVAAHMWIEQRRSRKQIQGQKLEVRNRGPVLVLGFQGGI